MRRVADLGGGHDAVRLEEAVRRVRVCGLVFGVGVHGLGELAGSVPPTCEGEGKEQEKKNIRRVGSQRKVCDDRENKEERKRKKDVPTYILFPGNVSMSICSRSSWTRPQSSV